ncbi:MAG: hypothetical protein ACT4QD_04925 [Acidobacteriota bacterium]
MRRLALALPLALAAVSCGDQASTPTSFTPLDIFTRTWTGSLAVGGSRFFSFTVSGNGGTINVTLASVTSPATGLPLSPVLEIGVGIPAGTDCALSTFRQVAPSLVSQLEVALPAGVYCVRVADIGRLTSPVTFAVRFSHP